MHFFITGTQLQAIREMNPNILFIGKEGERMNVYQVNLVDG